MVLDYPSGPNVVIILGDRGSESVVREVMVEARVGVM
jgi:hypothetical protein